MIPSSILKLDKAEICEIYFSVDMEKKFSGINSEDFDFNFRPLDARSDKKKKKMLFKIKTNKDNLGVKFEICVGYEYSYFSSKPIQEEALIGVTAIFPQIISFLRGILLMISSCTPRPVLLPSIDAIRSYNDWKEKHQKTGKDHNPKKNKNQLKKK